MFRNSKATLCWALILVGVSFSFSHWLPFSFAEQNEPHPFAKLSPPKGAKVEAGAVTFSWQRAEGADNYYFHLKDTTNNTDSDVHAWFVGDVASKTINLSPCRHFVWQVRAYQGEDPATQTEADQGQWWWLDTLGCPPTPTPLPTLQISVDAATENGGINTNVFGINAGFWASNNWQWDRRHSTTAKPIVQLLKPLHLPLIRFGGLEALKDHWYQMIGPMKERVPQPTDSSENGYYAAFFGPDELMTYINQIGGGKAVIAVNVPYYSSPCPGTAVEAAKWVEYMNAPSPSADQTQDWHINDYKGTYRQAILAEDIDEEQTSFKIFNNQGLSTECGLSVVKLGDEWIKITSLTPNSDNSWTVEAIRAFWSEHFSHLAGEKIGWWDYSTLAEMPEGYFAWLRAQYGHPEPYAVQYWELGNENLDWPFRQMSQQEGDAIFNQYVEQVKKYIPLMKAVKSTVPIKVGVTSRGLRWLYPDGPETDSYQREEDLLRAVGSQIDFIILHLYSPAVNPTDENNSEDEMYHLVAGIPQAIQQRIIDAKITSTKPNKKDLLILNVTLGLQ